MPAHGRPFRCAYQSVFWPSACFSERISFWKRRSPSARLASPRGQKADRTPTHVARLQAARGRVTPTTPHSGVKRRNPAASRCTIHKSKHLTGSFVLAHNMVKRSVAFRSSVEGVSPPGVFAKLPTGQWRLSPEDNVLQLFHSPQEHKAHADLLQSPNFKARACLLSDMLLIA